ncbi:MAG: NUDIX domain-containing protein [Patescibacteria group bacterium]
MNPVKKIPRPLYRKIHQVLPIVTVDLVIRKKNEFLLVKRNNDPKANRWYFPGGRILKDEKVKGAAIRKLKEEVGLIGENWKFLGFHEHFYDLKHSYFRGFSSHVISLVFMVDIKSGQKVTLDSQGSDYRWFRRVQKKFDSYHKQFLKLAKFGY